MSPRSSKSARLTSPGSRSTDAAQQVERLLNELSRLNDAELVMLRASWEGEASDERNVAQIKAQAANRRQPRRRMIEAARSNLTEWLNDHRYSPINRFEGSWVVGSDSLSTGDTRSRAVPAILDAVAAIVAGDRLSSKDRALLLGPALEVIRNHEAGS